MRPTLVAAAFDFLPPRLRTSLLDDKEFVKRWDLANITGVTIGRDGPSFHREQFYGAIREAIREPRREIAISDDKSVTWRISARPESEGFSLLLENGEKHLSIGDHSGLSDEQSVRGAWLDKVAREVNLGVDEFQRWKVKIDSAPLDDQEFADLTDELELTPVRTFRNLQAGISRGSIDIATLVRSERRYYELLVGTLGSSVDTVGYIEDGATRLIDELQEWEPTVGFLYSLLMCSKGTVSERIRTEKLDSEKLLRTYEWLANQGDPVSQLGAVEVALRNIENHPGLEPFIERIVERFIDDDPDHSGGCFSLLSAMIVLVASELSRKRILEDVRPFYRKQAAIAQASLIIRAIFGSQVDTASVVEWSKTRGFGYIFFLQGLIDLRAEPRWLPDFVSPYQLRAEFIGRVTNAVELCQGTIRSESLQRLLIGENSKLAMSVAWSFRILPGPLEGEISSQLPTIPDEVLEEVAVELEAKHLEPNSFAGLVNMAFVFKTPISHAGLAAKALRRVKYSIESAEGDDSVFGLIAGLATVAAVTRGTDLAEELRVLVRVMRRRKRLNVDPDDEMRVAMVAAASHENVEDWARFAGEWMTELAFEVVEMESAQCFLPKLRRLVQVEPALARHCAAADAALASVARS